MINRRSFCALIINYSLIETVIKISGVARGCLRIKFLTKLIKKKKQKFPAYDATCFSPLHY